MIYQVKRALKELRNIVRIPDEEKNESLSDNFARMCNEAGLVVSISIWLNKKICGTVMKYIMEQLVRVPFDLEMAKRIQKNECEGKVVTRGGLRVRIVCFDMKSDDRVVALVQDEFKESVYTYTPDGLLVLNGENKYDLMLEVPEYMTFKDGDIYKTELGGIAIYNDNYKARNYSTPYYVGIRNDNILVFHKEDSDSGFGHLSSCTLSVTEEEKKKLFDALKARNEPKAKDYCDRFFGIEEKKEYEFNPFDKVLVRDDDGVWFAGIFSHLRKDGEFLCVGAGLWKQCIPYNEKTAHLLGTNDNWEGE